MKRREIRGGLILVLLALASTEMGRPCVGAEVAGDQSRRAEAFHLYSMAQQSLLGRDYAEALTLMEQAAAQDDSPGLLLELAQLRFSLNDLDRAAALAERIVAADPKQVEAHKLLGDIYLSRGREGSDPEANLARAVDQLRAALEGDPADEEACRSLAEIYYRTGRLDETAVLLQTFARGRPLDQAMSLLLGKADLRTGRYAEAEAILTGIVARSPGNLEAVDALAALFEYQKKYDESIALYAGLVRHGSATAYLQDRIGSLHLLAGRYRDAIRELEEGQRLDPDDTRGLLALAQAYEGAGDTAVALAAYDRLIQREPGNLEARFHRARLVQHEGDPGAALESFRSILDLASGRGALTEREETVLSLTHSQIGLIDLESRDFDGAAAAFDKSIESSHDAGPELYLLLGRAHLEKGRMQEALSAVAAGRERYPDDLDLRVFEGEVSVARGDLDEARTYYKTLLKSQKRSPEAYQAISEALLRHKRFEDAEAILKEGTRLHPASDALTFARGAALERLGRLGEAERLLSKAIHLNPKNAAALNYLGYMLADRGMRLKDSLAYVERALAIEPKNAAYLDSLGWAQFRLALYEPAERNLREAARYDPADPAIREHLGDLLMATGRPEEAIKEWRTALARGHEEPDKVQAKIDRAGAARKADR